MKQSTHAQIHKKIVRAVGVTTAIAVLLPAVSMPEGLEAAAATQGNATKSESVYVNVDASGKVEQETVSDWLHDDTSGAVVADQSQLTDIANVKGTEKPQINGSNVTWTLSGNDLYYQGKTTKSLPVSMTAQYFLDGKSITPSELAGRSGKFELKLSFRNNDAHSVTVGGQAKTVYTPFVCLAAFDLPGKTFANVTTNFGTVVSDGTNQAVTFMGFPGLKQSFDMLDLSSLNLPDELDVTADVKDFSLGPIMMAATPVPDMDSLKNTGDLNSLTDKLQQLISAGVQLKDATGQLNAGEAAFSDGVAQLVQGINTAGTSFDSIVSGAQTLSSASADARNGIPALISGANGLASGADQVSGGLDQLYAQFPALQSGVGQLDSGVQQIADGVGQLLSQFTVTSGGNSNNAADSANRLSAGVTQYAGQAGLVDGTLFGLTEYNLQTLQSTLYSALGNNAGLTAAAMNNAVAAEHDVLHGAADAAVIQAVQKYLAYAASPSASAKAAFVTALSQAVGYINLYDVFNVVSSDPKVLTPANQNQTQTAETAFENEMKSGSCSYLYTFGTDANSPAKTLDTYLQTDAAALAARGVTLDAESLSQTAAALQSQGVDIGQTFSQILTSQNIAKNIVLAGAALSQGTSDLSAALTTTVHDTLSQINTGFQDPHNGLKAGTASLLAQMKTSGNPAEPSLYDAVTALDSGAHTLAAGAHTLASGASGLTALQSGIGSLADALGLFRGGLSTIRTGAATLNDSSRQLASGAAALHTGMSQFWDQGLSRLQSVDTGKINQALAVKDEMIRLADNYTSFCGTGSDIPSNVKFVIKTDEIKAAAQTSTQPSHQPSAKSRTIWQKIGNWLNSLFHAND